MDVRITTYYDPESDYPKVDIVNEAGTGLGMLTILKHITDYRPGDYLWEAQILIPPDFYVDGPQKLYLSCEGVRQQELTIEHQYYRNEANDDKYLTQAQVYELFEQKIADLEAKVETLQTQTGYLIDGIKNRV